MATKPVITIDVDASKFDKFFELFQSYEKALGDQPAAWDALNDAMAGAGKALESGAVSSEKSLHKAADEAQRVVINLRQAGQITTSHTKGFESMGKAGSGAWKAIGGAADASIGKTSAGLMDMIKSLAPMAEEAGGAIAAALGPIGAIVAAIGGTVAAKSALANIATPRQRFAFGLGTTTGKAASFANYANQFLDQDALSAAADNQLSLNSEAPLSVLGIDFNKAVRMSPGDLAIAKLRAATAIFKNAAPGTQKNQAGVQAYIALGGHVEDLRNAAMMGSPALDRMQANVTANARSMGFDKNAVDSGAILNQAIGGGMGRVQALAVNKLSIGDQAVAKAIDFATGGPSPLRDKIANALSNPGPAFTHLTTVIEKGAAPALNALKGAADQAKGGLKEIADAARVLTIPLTAREAAAASLGAGESGGNWRIVNSDSGALGKWQFMPGTADSHLGAAWLKKYGSTSTAAGRAAFLGSPKAQTAAFNDFYDELYRDASKRTKDPKQIQRMIALGWYGGEGSWNETQAQLNAPQTYGGHSYPSQNSYADAFLKRVTEMQRNTRPPTVNVKVSNPTQARVAVSINAAALTSQF